MLINWDESLSTPGNLKRFQEENVFGKASRSRVRDILKIFRQRYLHDEDVANSLVFFAKSGISGQMLNPILYFFSTQSDPLLHDIVTDFLFEFQLQGRTDISVEDIRRVLSAWIEEGKIATSWSPSTIQKSARSIMATLRDFGILQGAVNKKVAPIYLPTAAFAFLAFQLNRSQKSGEKLLHNPEWRLFFFDSMTIERFFIEAHQQGLLQYHAAGHVIRIEFPATTLVEYAHYVTEKTN